MQTLESQFKNNVTHASVDTNRGFLVACSGGIDSMVLLYLMHTFLKKQTYAVYVMHHVRPVEQQEEAKMIASFCEKLSIPYTITAIPKDAKLTETTMRTLRYELLRAHKKHPDDYIVTAHHQDDLLETFLFRLIRGTGPIGSRGFSLLDNDILRPMYTMHKKQLIEYAHKHTIPYSLDRTNYTDEHARNIIRHHILPYMKTINTHAEQNLYSFIELQQEYLQEINRLYNSVIHSSRLIQKEMQPISQIIGQHIIGQWLREQDVFWINYSREQWGNLHEWVTHSKSGSTYSLAATEKQTKPVLLINEFGSISIHNETAPLVPQHINEGDTDIGVGSITMQTVHAPSSNHLSTIPNDAGQSESSQNEVVITIDSHDLPLRVRSWQKGDRFSPHKGNGTVTIQNLFTNLKIPKSKRHLIPIIVDKNDTILWVCGIRCATISPNQKRPITIKLTYHAKKIRL